MKRIALFVVTNLAIVLVLMLFLNIIGAVFGINFGGMAGRQLDLFALGIFALVVGFSGAFISLLISKPMAKWSTGAQVIQQPSNAMEQWLVDTVRRHADKAGIGMPEVALYEGEPNAFATGATKNSSLVAVSTGLLQSMSKDEVEAVLAHEVAHIANGDMVTMTLIQGVMNTFVVFLSRVIGWAIDRVILKNESDSPGIGYWVSVIVLDIVLGFLAAIIVAWFSRQREYRADAGAAAYMGSSRPMVSALARLGGLEPGELPQQVKAMGISSRPSGLMALFSSHPALEDRIAALQAGGK
jgi:heat shock protein HtpX